MASSKEYDSMYYTLKIWRERTMPAFIRLKSLRQLREGKNLDNVQFLDRIIKEALAREEEAVQKDYDSVIGGKTT